ncbi:MAG: VWA domain-containing protein [Myxococcales bacterium]|nr:VWA domain-containing protein [Myxococcales bacterium]
MRARRALPHARPARLRAPSAFALVAPFVLVLVLALSCAGVAPPARAAAPSADVVEVVVDAPLPGERVENDVHMVAVRGRARAGDEAWSAFDVLVAIDVSYSTREPSGIDVDGDGEVGFDPERELVEPGRYPEGTVCTDPDDTILAAEVSAAGVLLGELDAARTRVGLVAFSGETDPETGLRVAPDQRDAWVVVPLTHDFGEVRAALGDLLREGPRNATNFAAAIRLAVTELAGLPGAQSAPREGARRVLLFLTDGQPSFPYGSGAVSDRQDVEAAIDAARLADKASVVVNTYALGRQALARPVAATEMARITSGTYTAVRNPGDIVHFLKGISFANVDDVLIANRTLREVSVDVSLAPDGSFSGLVPARPGANELEVTALASDGREASAVLEIEFAEATLGARELERELARIRQRNKELLRLLERERIERFRARRREVVIGEDAEGDASAPSERAAPPPPDSGRD